LLADLISNTFVSELIAELPEVGMLGEQLKNVKIYTDFEHSNKRKVAVSPKSLNSSNFSPVDRRLLKGSVDDRS
jgi:hypothetical protein